MEKDYLLMRNRILEIVVLMVDFIQEKKGHLSGSEELSSTLRTMGYTDVEISSAYSWLMDRFDDTPEEYFSNFSAVASPNRVLTELERSILTPEAHNYLIRLLNLSLIDQAQFEMILDRATLLAAQPVVLDHMKLLVSSVLFREIDEVDQLIDAEPGNRTSLFIN